MCFSNVWFEKYVFLYRVYRNSCKKWFGPYESIFEDKYVLFGTIRFIRLGYFVIFQFQKNLRFRSRNVSKVRNALKWIMSNSSLIHFSLKIMSLYDRIVWENTKYDPKIISFGYVWVIRVIFIFTRHVSKMPEILVICSANIEFC